MKTASPYALQPLKAGASKGKAVFIFDLNQREENPVNYLFLLFLENSITAPPHTDSTNAEVSIPVTPVGRLGSFSGSEGAGASLGRLSDCL